MQDNSEHVNQEIDRELHRRSLADRVIRRMKAVEDFEATKREEERQRQWETEHHHTRRPPQPSHSTTADNSVLARSPRIVVRIDGSRLVRHG
jgi:hypothetical protein